MSLHIPFRICLSTLPGPVLICEVGQNIKQTIRNQDNPAERVRANGAPLDQTSDAKGSAIYPIDVVVWSLTSFPTLYPLFECRSLGVRCFEIVKIPRCLSAAPQSVPLHSRVACMHHPLAARTN